MATHDDDVEVTTTIGEGDGDGPADRNCYILDLEEFDGKEVFWSGGELGLRPSIVLELKERDMDVPLSSILSVYVPRKVLRKAVGGRHLELVGTKRQVKLDDPVRLIFEMKNGREAKLYLHFGSGYPSDGDKEDEFQKDTEKLTKVLGIPGFLRSKNGIQFQKLMCEIDEEFKASAPDHFKIQEKLNALNGLVDATLEKHEARKGGTAPAQRNYIAYLAYGALLVVAVAYFIFKD